MVSGAKWNRETMDTKDNFLRTENKRLWCHIQRTEEHVQANSFLDTNWKMWRDQTMVITRNL